MIITNMTMRKAMIADDDTAVREIIGTMISDHFTVFYASDGKEAIEMYRMLKPDIVLMDILMPEMDGIQATKEIKRIDPEAKILAVTAYASSKGGEILSAGALDVIEKPISKSKLIEKIKKYL